jgi:hypothetical protein
VSEPAHRPRRARVPRRVEAGARRAQAIGDRLACLVIGRLETEWIGVDLGSGAFVRVVGALGVELPPIGGPSLIVEIRVGLDPDPADPARTESVVPATDPVRVGNASNRVVRRLLHRLSAPERRGATVLGTRGPSIAYVDLDGSTPSLTLLEVPTKSLELIARDSGDVVLGFGWGGTHHLITVADQEWREIARTSRRARAGVVAVELGRRTAFVLIGLGPIEQGHARKVVLALL